MQAGIEFLLQGQHNAAMGLPFGRGTRMTGMFCAVIRDFQLYRLKSFS
mgnify:CR=1 FL=1